MHLGRTARISLRIVQKRGLSVRPVLALLPRIQRPLQPPRPLICRTFATPPPLLNVSDLPIETYHAYSDATMEHLLESLENILDEIDNPEYEVEYSSGVLTLKLGEKGTYVINKQPPNKQIWLSSPVSGPKRYDYVEQLDDWIYSRDNGSLGDLLNTELSEALQQDINLHVEHVSNDLD